MKHGMIRRLQKMMFPEFVNSMKPRNKEREVSCGKLHSDICYGTTYPNSYMDIYQSSVIQEEPLPVFVYCHGGGYTWGDKVEGDPNAKEQSFWYFEELLKAGYHIVSVNYALAPEYQYPVPLLQLSQCMEFLKIHAQEYGIDMTRVIFSGSSAGAHLTGQYVNILTNESYAQQMKLVPALKKEQVMAYVSTSGLLDCERFDKTDAKSFNFILRKCAKAYFEVRKIEGNKDIKGTNVITYMSDDFPPCFISDGNRGTFTNQAKDMAKNAEKLGIRYQLKLYPKEIAVLGHGFELGESEQAKEVMKLTIDFLKSL